VFHPTFHPVAVIPSASFRPAITVRLLPREAPYTSAARGPTVAEWERRGSVRALGYDHHLAWLQAADKLHCPLARDSKWGDWLLCASADQRGENMGKLFGEEGDAAGMRDSALAGEKGDVFNAGVKLASAWFVRKRLPSST
jgi:hypothetical protein